jgi:hypothetical protein
LSFHLSFESVSTLRDLLSPKAAIQ